MYVWEYFIITCYNIRDGDQVNVGFKVFDVFYIIDSS